MPRHNLDEAMRRLRTNTMSNIDPAVTTLLEQLYTSWRNSMSNAGVTIDENTIKALMVTMTMIGNDDWADLANRFGVTVDFLVIAMLSVSIDPESADPKELP